EARYDLVSLIDDDNWVCPEWVRLANEVMRDNPDVGACGGWNEAVFEAAPPAWFPACERIYAVGAQAEAPGVIPGLWACLCGAGITLRQSAWQGLLAGGFRPLLSGRQGAALTSGED